jgi:hypothetical protein
VAESVIPPLVLRTQLAGTPSPPPRPAEVEQPDPLGVQLDYGSADPPSVTTDALAPVVVPPNGGIQDNAPSTTASSVVVATALDIENEDTPMTSSENEDQGEASASLNHG